MKSVKIYFVLYIVLLCELFLVILDRDEATDAWFKYLENQDPLCELKFSNGQNERVFLSLPYNANSANIEYHLYTSGFISKQEMDSTRIIVNLENSDNNNIHWNKMNLSVNEYNKKDSMVENTFWSKIKLIKKSDNVYSLSISYTPNFVLRLMPKNLSNIVNTLSFSTFFTTKGKLPLDSTGFHLEKTITNYIKTKKELFPHLFRVVNKDSIIISKPLRFILEPFRSGVKIGDH